MAELVPVNILIGDRTYRIRTSPEDEGNRTQDSKADQ